MKKKIFFQAVRKIASAVLFPPLLGFFLSACADGALDGGPVIAEFGLPKWREEAPPGTFGNGEESSVRMMLVRWNVEAVFGKRRRSFIAGAEDRSVRIEVQRNGACAVLARPVVRVECSLAEDGVDSAVVSELEFFRPCGAVYPFQDALSWQDGFSASCLSDFYAYALEAGVSEEAAVRHASCFNWTKFSSSLAEKGGGADCFYNPWQLDKGAVLSAIASRSFSVSLLAQKKSASVPLEALSVNQSLAVASQYVPQNEAALRSGAFTMREAVPESFLLVLRPGGLSGAEGEGGASKAAFLKAVMPSKSNAQKITLALKPVPIYTESL